MHAASITVNTTADELDADGDCSLREAITAANTDAAVSGCAAGNGADDITVPAGTYTLTRVGAREDGNATGDLDIAGDVTITGAGGSLTIVDGNATDRVLQVHSGVVVVEDLGVRHGVAPSGAAGRDCIDEFRCDERGGGGETGGGILTGGGTDAAAWTCGSSRSPATVWPRAVVAGSKTGPPRRRSRARSSPATPTPVAGPTAPEPSSRVATTTCRTSPAAPSGRARPQRWSHRDPCVAGDQRGGGHDPGGHERVRYDHGHRPARREPSDGRR